MESLATGGGIAFLVIAFPRPLRTGISRRLALSAYVGIGFLLFSWWPHAYLRAIAIDAETAAPVLRQAIYGLHDVFMAVCAVLALFFVRAQTAQATTGERLVGEPRLTSTWKFAILAVAVAATSLPLTSILYAALRLPSGRVPVGWLLAGLLLNTGFTRLALGSGVAFLIFAWRFVGGAHRGLSVLAFVSIAWGLLSWWPYQQIDFLTGGSLYPQIILGYGFHLTLILAGVVLAIFFYRVTHTPTAADSGEQHTGGNGCASSPHCCDQQPRTGAPLSGSHE